MYGLTEVTTEITQFMQFWYKNFKMRTNFFEVYYFHFFA